MTFSEAGLEAANASADGVVSLVLLEIQMMGETIRIVNDTVAVTHLGNRYEPFPFRFSFPDDRDGQPSEATLEICNVDQSIMALVRQLTQPATVRAKIVRASSPDVVEADYPFMLLTGVSADLMTITGTLAGDILENEPCPFIRFDTRFPYIFETT